MSEPKFITPRVINNGLTIGQFLVCMSIFIPLALTVACVLAAVCHG